MAAASSQVDKYLADHASRFEDQLFTLLRIPSVSAQPDHNADTRRAAEFIRDDLRAMGVAAELIEFPSGNPIVYGERLDAPGKPTLLVYGHYDVQPAEPLEPWNTPPFEPTVRDGNVYARGATDDKGQMLTHLKAAEGWLKTAGSLPINVKFLIEGEEEVGGRNLEKFLAENPAKLACDYAVISDTSQFARGMPAVTYGLKGLAYFELRVQGANRDLHSGTYGGAVQNPINVLCAILASFKRPDDGRIQIDGFLDDVRPLQDWERAEFAKLPFSESEFAADLDVKDLSGEAGYSTLERKWARPTCDINGIWGGYSGPGPKTVLPCKAGAKFSFRLVPDQDNRKIAQAVRRHIERHAPPGITWELEDMHGAPAVLVDTKTPGFAAATRAIETAFGTRPVFIREGGSIPVVGLIKQHLNVDTLLLGWGQNDDNLHGPNEKFSLADFHRGIRAAAHLMAELAG